MLRNAPWKKRNNIRYLEHLEHPEVFATNRPSKILYSDKGEIAPDAPDAPGN